MNYWMNLWVKLRFIYFPQINILLGLLLGRILFAALVISVLICIIMLARKRLSPNLRSWLWGLCIPALFIPFEHGVVAITRSLCAPDLPSGKYLCVLEILHYVLSYIWLAGFIAFSIKTRRNQNNTMRLLRSSKISGCAAYFYKGCSHIYLPPDFERNYTEIERKLLLAHENQHIAQHDPLLYRLLQTVQCVFWFNPLIHIAARHIRQDRELLCDERVTRDRPKREYGMLLLREAQKSAASNMLAGIASDPCGVYERIAACVKPFSGNKKPAVIITVIAALIFAAGLTGFVKPITQTSPDICLSIIQDNGAPLVESAEGFILSTPEGMDLDQQKLSEYAESLGLKPEQRLDISVAKTERMTLTGGCYTVSGCVAFTVSELATEDICLPPYGTGSAFFDTLFRVL